MKIIIGRDICLCMFLFKWFWLSAKNTSLQTARAISNDRRRRNDQDAGGLDCFLRWSLACTEQARMTRRNLSWFHLVPVDQFVARNSQPGSHSFLRRYSPSKQNVSSAVSSMPALCGDSIRISRRVSIAYVLSSCSVERARKHNATVDWRTKSKRLPRLIWN